MKTKSILILVFPGLLALAGSLPAALETPVTEARAVGGFELYRDGLSGLYWWAESGPCTEIVREKVIRIRPLVDLAESTATVGSACPFAFGGVTRQDPYVYFANNGRLYRKAVYTPDSVPAEEITTLAVSVT